MSDKKKKFVKLINEVVNRKLKKERAKMAKVIKKNVMKEVKRVLHEFDSGRHQPQQQQQMSQDPVVHEVLQSQNTKDFSKEAVREGANEQMSGQQEFSSVDEAVNQIRQIQRNGGNEGHPADQIPNQQQPSQAQQQILNEGMGGAQMPQGAQQQAQMTQGGEMPQGGGMPQGAGQMNPAAAAAMQGGGGGQSPVSLEGGGMPVAGSGAYEEGGAGKSAVENQPQGPGPQQGSKENWPSVDGNQQMGGAIPSNQTAAAQAQQQPGGPVPDHLKKARSRDYSELVNRFEG